MPIIPPHFDNLAAHFGAEDAVETDLAGGAECRGDVAVRQAADDGEGVLPLRPSATSECETYAFVSSTGRPCGVRR